MRFARIVYVGAGIWGILVLTPLLFLVDLSGRAYPAPTSYPHFFYGFIGIALAWQTAFLVIGSDPRRFRMLMLPTILEKLGYIIPAAALYAQGRITAPDALTAAPDAVLCLLFVTAFAKTSVLPDREPLRAQPGR
jgi:hypothetical protein